MSVVLNFVEQKLLGQCVFFSFLFFLFLFFPFLFFLLGQCVLMGEPQSRRSAEMSGLELTMSIALSQLMWFEHDR